ncbi:MAG: nucleotidyltransferase domain-containing protein [Anaerolineae bacterium]|nr:nucleotidyltransferase domain-containing protein [Anaerolineae bacterium]
MPTALELGPKGWQPYIEAARKRVIPAAPTVDPEERARLLTRVREAARALKEQFGARRVLLFGSLAHAAWFFPDSDVDLVVDGIPPADFWRAWAVAEEIIGDRPVDLIDLDMVSDSMREAIEAYGVER